ncbi:hypothetical protein NQZ68_029568 [Dissostichus eleginoides]|nr:hypothetical protein NQZ68_029568 [Dissostichus eleginoides]
MSPGVCEGEHDDLGFWLSEEPLNEDARPRLAEEEEHPDPAASTFQSRSFAQISDEAWTMWGFFSVADRI